MCTDMALDLYSLEDKARLVWIRTKTADKIIQVRAERDASTAGSILDQDAGFLEAASDAEKTKAGIHNPSH
jgi:hypothetical protein